MTAVERIEIRAAIARADEILCSAAPIALDAMHDGDLEGASAAVAELRAAGQALGQALARIDRADRQGALVLRDAQDTMYALKSWA